MAEIETIVRYPVKGLSPERLSSVTLTAGLGVPGDRAYAIEAGSGHFDPEEPKALPKVNFLMLMRNPRLAALETQFDETDQTLTILRDGKQVARGTLATWIGRQILEQFFAGYMANEMRGAPRIVSAERHSFTDLSEPCLSIVNLDTVDELSRIAQTEIDPIRFRANLHIRGLDPWAEFSWVGRTLTAGDGVRLSVFAQIDRCEATNANPLTGECDMSVPSLLERSFGHQDFGIYARVEQGGTLRTGSQLSLADRGA